MKNAPRLETVLGNTPPIQAPASQAGPEYGFIHQLHRGPDGYITYAVKWDGALHPKNLTKPHLKAGLPRSAYLLVNVGVQSRLQPQAAACLLTNVDVRAGGATGCEGGTAGVSDVPVLKQRPSALANRAFDAPRIARARHPCHTSTAGRGAGELCSL